MAIGALSISSGTGNISSSSSSPCCCSSVLLLRIGRIQELKSRKWCSTIVCCERGKEKKELIRQMKNFGKGFQDFLRPKQKGDWKDLLLMSFSFAVYVYISQLLVSAFCAWNTL